MRRAKLLIVTTVSDTLEFILRYQPKHLSGFFLVGLVTSFVHRRDANRLEMQEGVPVFNVPMSRGISLSRDLVSIVMMLIYFLRTRPDIVHSYTPKAGLVTMLAAWLCRVPIRTHTFTGLIFPTQTGFRQKLLVCTDRLICACATHIVPEGEGVKRDLQRFGITKKDLQVIGYGNIAGVDTAYYWRQAPGLLDASRALRLSLGISPTDFVFCFVGRLNRDKGVRELVAAFAVLPAKCHLLILGALDDTAPVDEATLHVMGTHQRIHQLGFLSDIRPALGTADILVLPSYREGFPNVVLQAGAMQLPVIATDVPGCNEVIEPEFNGWLVPPLNTRSLQNAMQVAITAPPQLLEHMGIQSRKRIQERFERDAHWQRMVNFYRNNLAAAGLG